MQTKENKAQVIEILKKWIEDNGGDVFTADHDLYGAAQNKRDRGEVSSESFKKVAGLFGVEKFFKTKEAHSLATTNFRFFQQYPYQDRFVKDDEVKSYRELFNISDKEFEKVITEKSAGYAEKLSKFEFARKGSNNKGDYIYYEFDYFAREVDRLNKFLIKYPVPEEALEYVAKTILTHGSEVLNEKISTDKGNRNIGNWDSVGANQYHKFLDLIKKQPFLQPFIKSPDLQKVGEDFVNRLILQILEDTNRPDSYIEDIQEINSTFGLQKPDISKIEGINNVPVRTGKFRLSTYEVNNFLTELQQVANLNQEFIFRCVTEAIEHSLENIWKKDGWDNIYDRFEKVFKNIQSLTTTYNIDSNYIISLTDKIARSIDRNSGRSYHRYGNVNQEQEYDGQSLFDKIKKTVGISPEFSKELLTEELVEQFNRWVNYSDHNDEPWNIVQSAEEKLEEYSLDRSVLTEIVISAYNGFLAEGKNKEGEKLVQAFGILPEALNTTDTSKIEKLKIKKATDLLSSGDLQSALTFVESNPDIKEKLKELVEIQEKIKPRIIEILNGGDSEKALKVIEYFVSNKTTPEDILKLDSVKEAFFDKLSESYPKLAKKYLSSFNSLFNIWEDISKFGEAFQMLLDKQFLAEALENNDRYGLKLLLKFSSLDKLSKANIETLYKNKTDILNENPDIDPNSRDFRIAMQNKLESYRRNFEIFSVLRKAGIDAEEWLNHEDEEYFELGRDRSLKFSDTIVTPIERIKETIDQYIETIKEVLEPYKNELTSFRVPLKNVDELKAELEKLKLEKQKADEDGNIKKADGITKGISNIERQIANSKDIPLWEKTLSSLSLIDLVKKDIFKAYGELRETEVKLAEKETDTAISAIQKRKELVKLKSKIELAKKELKEKVLLLSGRLTEFDHDFFLSISPALGEDRTESLQQEKNEGVQEHIDHYYSDSETLKNIFFEKEDSGLDGQPMKISVWDRNPDIDLYLGNYTDCCIRIDSAHMGEESTIADYLTDVGMQIVNIYDEKKKIPVATAWCWVGHDDDDQVAFVIDNIEANTDYSTKYKTQLEEKLKEYMINYSKKVGAKLVQGRSNNDLVVASMDSSYFKLGGFNRASGYFLEAEDE